MRKNSTPLYPQNKKIFPKPRFDPPPPFPPRAVSHTPARISALLKPPYRARNGILLENFTIRFLFPSAPLPRQVSTRRKNVRTARRCRAPLPRCNFYQENNTDARLPALRARENPPPPAGTRQFFAAKLQPPAAKFALPIPPQFPKISAFRAKPTLLRRDNTARRGIKEAQRFRRKFLPSRLRGRVCFQLSPPPRAQGRRRCAPRS